MGRVRAAISHPPPKEPLLYLCNARVSVPMPLTTGEAARYSHFPERTHTIRSLPTHTGQAKQLSCSPGLKCTRGGCQEPILSGLPPSSSPLVIPSTSSTHFPLPRILPLPLTSGKGRAWEGGTAHPSSPAGVKSLGSKELCSQTQSELAPRQTRFR